jgi:hypothetical protein
MWPKGHAHQPLAAHTDAPRSGRMLSPRPVVGTLACTRSRTARPQVVLCQPHAQIQTEGNQENMLEPKAT